MPQKRVVLHHPGNILHLELCSPPANKTDRLFFDEFSQIIAGIGHDPEIRGLIVSGQGRHFSSGADIEELKEKLGPDNAAAVEESTHRSLGTLHCLTKMPFPVVAAIRGCCLGSGMELALSCHYRICTNNALFSLPETRFGLMPGCGGTIRLPQLVGLGKGLELILSGRNLLADDALHLGIVDLIADKNDLMDTAHMLIEKHRQLFPFKSPLKT
ncbi:MAG: enoyl-CoA hydratase/isomerase family protein [Desulfobulbaceae bacterium]|nr:enoyl-CoA hydratase/isomerase family protein [Desulfobulbaceae bacterium]